MKKNRFPFGRSVKLGAFALLVLILPTAMSAVDPGRPSAPLFLLAGHVGGTYLTLADDISAAVQSAGIRVMPMVGRGSQQTLADLIEFDEVTLATLQSDVLDLSTISKNAGQTVDSLYYITTLGFEEFHVVASRSVESIYELEGKRVSIGPSESGSAVTARFVFSDLGINIDPVTLSNRQALTALKAGDVAAITRVVAQPAPFFSDIPEEDFHFVSVPAQSIRPPYVATTLEPESYPRLADGEVETVAVAAVLATMFDPDDKSTAKAIENFAIALLSNIDDLRTDAHHPKWEGIEPRVDLAGWPRLPAAQAVLDTGPIK